MTDTYAYDEGDKLTSIARGGNTVRSFTYEKFGRMATSVENSVTTYYAYDYESRLTSVTKSGMTTNTFSYNGLDTRVGKVDSVGTMTYKRDGAYVTDPVLSDGAAKYTPGISERRSTTTKYPLSDYLGSTTKIVGSNESTTDAKQYDAFGNTTSSSGSTPHPFNFAGQWGYQSEPDTSLQLLGHRYYDPTIGRFLTRDPIKDGRNWLTYCGNNSTSTVDPEGFGVVAIIRVIFKGAGRVWEKSIGKGAAKLARARGKNIGVSGPPKSAPRIAKQIEDSVEGKTIYHGPDDDIYGQGHYQTEGHPGHTFVKTPIIIPFSDLGDQIGDGIGGGLPGGIAKELIDIINPLGDLELVTNLLLEVVTGGLGNWWETWPDKDLLPMPGQLAGGNGSPRYH